MRRLLTPYFIAASLFAALCTVPGATQAQEQGPTPANAQQAVPEPAALERARDLSNVRSIKENEQRVDELLREKSAEIRSVGNLPRTPLQLLLLLTEANAAKDFERGGTHLDMRYLPDALSGWTPDKLLRALSVVWAQQNVIDITAISDRPEGHLDDGLPDYRDLLGVIVRDNGEEVPIYMQRIPDQAGGQVWKISNASVAEIPELWRDLGYGPLAVWAQSWLPDYRFAGMYTWQLIAMGVFIVLAWPLAGLVSFVLLRLTLAVPNNFGTGIQTFFRGPLKLFLFVVIMRLLMDQLALSLTARAYLNSSGADYIAFSILLLGLISLARDYNMRRLERLGNRQYIALLRPFTTIVKILALTIVGLIWADRAGYNMSTIIAGLGVGSLAVALAAQKTLENVIGAITLYTARPVNPGDLCRFGDIVGVVEEIGLRSTMIRTLNRTMLAVPNSVFSSVEVENFSHRDRIRYFQQVELQMSTADQLRVILCRLRELFLSHAELMQETVSIRLEKIAAATAVIRIDAGVRTTDYQHYLAVAEDLNLRTIELVHAAGAVFGGPGQVLQIRDFQQASEETLSEVKAQLEQWRADGTLPFPDFSDAEKAALQGKITLHNTAASPPPDTSPTRSTES